MPQQPWWNRPIIGNQSIWQKLKARLIKPEVPRDKVVEHDREMQEVEKLANFIARVDSERFETPEFILLVKTKHYLERAVPGYEGLEDSAKLLEVALQAQDSFISIEQIEFQYRGFIQQAFYHQVFKLLSQNLSQTVFLKLLERLAQQTIPKIKSQEGKLAIQTYVEEIHSLASKHAMGIQLLYRFKLNDFKDFTILQKISNLLTEFHTKEVHNNESFLVAVKFNYDLFRDLGTIINIPEHQDQPEGYAKVLQYLVLLDKYKRSYQLLEELLKQLQKWYKHYKKIVALRQHYNSKHYKQPSEFQKAIPGLSFYHKYQRWLFQSLMTNMKSQSKVSSSNEVN